MLLQVNEAFLDHIVVLGASTFPSAHCQNSPGMLISLVGPGQPGRTGGELLLVGLCEGNKEGM